MAQLTANFETGVNGNNIAAADPGSATAFDAVTKNAFGLAAYDNAHIAFGSLAGKFGSTGAGAGNAYIEWTTALGTVTDYFFRLYLYLTAYDVGNIPIFWAGQGVTRGVRIDVNSTGKLLGFDNPAAALFT